MRKEKRYRCSKCGKHFGNASQIMMPGILLACRLHGKLQVYHMTITSVAHAVPSYNNYTQNCYITKKKNCISDKRNCEKKPLVKLLFAFYFFLDFFLSLQKMNRRGKWKIRQLNFREWRGILKVQRFIFKFSLKYEKSWWMKL